MQNYIIEIAAGQTFIEAANIPNWIADRLVPIPDVLPVLCQLQKKTLVEVNHWRIDDLTPADWSFLGDVWRDLPEVRGADIERFKDYRQAFDHANNKLDWVLHAEFQHIKEEAKDFRRKTRHLHFDLLEAAARSGKLTILSAQRAPTNKIEPGALISVADARTYLEPLGFDLRERIDTEGPGEVVELSLDDAVKIDDAAKGMGCSVDSLLREAASSKRLLYVALGPYSAALSAIPGHDNPRQGSHTPKSHSIVAMLPQYAESLAISGSADISKFQAGFVSPLDGHYWMLSAPQTVGIDSVFVPRSDVSYVAAQADTPAVKVESTQTAAQPKAGITKQKVMNAFEGMHFTHDKWGKYLATPPDWLLKCRVARGSKTASATWNPVDIAIALIDKGISINRLDAVLVRFRDWGDEWREKSDFFRD